MCDPTAHRSNRDLNYSMPAVLLPQLFHIKAGLFGDETEEQVVAAQPSDFTSAVISWIFMVSAQRFHQRRELMDFQPSDFTSAVNSHISSTFLLQMLVGVAQGAEARAIRRVVVRVEDSYGAAALPLAHLDLPTLRELRGLTMYRSK